MAGTRRPLLVSNQWYRTFSKESWLGSSSGFQIVARDDSFWSQIRDYLFLRHEFGGERHPGMSPAGQFWKHKLAFTYFTIESGKRIMECSCFIYVFSLNMPEWSSGTLDWWLFNYLAFHLCSHCSWFCEIQEHLSIYLHVCSVTLFSSSWTWIIQEMSVSGAVSLRLITGLKLRAKSH